MSSPSLLKLDYHYESTSVQERRTIHPPKSSDLDVSPPKKVKWYPLQSDERTYNMTSSASKQCVLISPSWQSHSYLNCNTMHESNFEVDMSKHLNLGEYRDVWLITRRGVVGRDNKEGEESFALKTLRISNGKLFSPQRAEQHRIDAVASERLSSSPYVAGIYGYCGQSVLNGLGTSTGKVFRQQKDLSSVQKLKYALDAARGIAAAHGIDEHQQEHDGGGEGGGGEGTGGGGTGGGMLAGKASSSLVHRDVRGPNYLLTNHGKDLMLHDFNAARLMRWDPTSGRPCGFIKKKDCNQWRSPEECMDQPLTEKIDVYSLGNVFYEIITGTYPYAKPSTKDGEKGKLVEDWKERILRGEPPTLPSKYTASEGEKGGDLVLQAIVDAMKKCHIHNPMDRPRAMEIVKELEDAVDRLMKQRERESQEKKEKEKEKKKKEEEEKKQEKVPAKSED